MERSNRAKPKMTDPRFTTERASDFSGSYYNRNMQFLLPAAAMEKWCEPGYQPKREDKGYVVAVNNYPFHNIHYGGSRWPEVVVTPFTTDN